MEVYLPIEVSKGQEKIKRLSAGQKRIPQSQKSKNNQKKKKKKPETLKQFVEQSEVKRPIENSKIIKAVLAEELMTDDSMKGIDY